MAHCIRVIDIETGPEPEGDQPGIIEIGYCDVLSTSTDLLGAPVDWFVFGGSFSLVNPGRPIPPETSAVHHLIDSDVVDAEPWSNVRHFFDDKSSFQFDAPVVAFAAHSAEFERSRIGTDLTGDLPWICTYKVALHLWPDAPSHSNNAIRYVLNPEGLERDRAQPTHRAFPDAYVTAFTLREALNAGHSVEQLVKWSNEPALLPRCKIGKWRNDGKGTPWTEVDSGFLHWMLDKDFDENTMFTARHHLDQREIDQRLERERQDMNQQYRANGFSEEPPMRESPPLSAYQDQGSLL